MQPWFILPVLFIPLFLVSIGMTVLELVTPETAHNVALITLALFAIVNAVVGWWGLSIVRESGDTTQVLLCKFIPLYIFLYTFMNWQQMKDYALAMISGLLLSPFALVMLVIAKIWLGADALEEMDL